MSLTQVLKVIVTSRIISFTLLSAIHSILSSIRVSAGVNFAVVVPMRQEPDPQKKW